MGFWNDVKNIFIDAWNKKDLAFLFVCGAFFVSGIIFGGVISLFM